MNATMIDLSLIGLALLRVAFPALTLVLIGTWLERMHTTRAKGPRI